MFIFQKQHAIAIHQETGGGCMRFLSMVDFPSVKLNDERGQTPPATKIGFSPTHPPTHPSLFLTFRNWLGGCTK